MECWPLCGVHHSLFKCRPKAPTPSPSGERSRWAVPKTDKLLIAGDAVATMFVIEDLVRERRDGREFILYKRYLRLVARLAPITKEQSEAVPPLNPAVLYAPLDQNDVVRETHSLQLPESSTCWTAGCQTRTDRSSRCRQSPSASPV